MTTSVKGTALVTGASSGIVERDPARNRPLPPSRVSGVGSDAHRRPPPIPLHLINSSFRVGSFSKVVTSIPVGPLSVGTVSMVCVLATIDVKGFAGHKAGRLEVEVRVAVLKGCRCRRCCSKKPDLCKSSEYFGVGGGMRTPGRANGYVEQRRCPICRRRANGTLAAAFRRWRKA